MPEPIDVRKMMGTVGTVRIRDGFPPLTMRAGKAAFILNMGRSEMHLAEPEQTQRPLLTFGPVGSEKGTIEVFFEEDEIKVRRGCFSGTLDDFAIEAGKHCSVQHAKSYAKIIEAIELFRESIELAKRT